MANSEFTFNPLSENIDRIWAGQSSDKDKRFSNYYDYYFSGEDIKVYIDGLFGPEHELDLASFAYSVRQEKQPIYGFWSYNFDAMMLGTRIVTGEFTLFTRYPRRMSDLLEEAAKARATSAEQRSEKNSIVSRIYSDTGQSIASSQDEANIQKYWAYSQLDRVTSDPASEEAKGKNIFSAHPPFNFIILYGVEETAISPTTMLQSQDIFLGDNLDRMVYMDVNERMIKVDNVVSPMKIVLQEVHLMNMSTAYTPGGQPVGEAYQFVARDYYLTEADLSFVKRLSTVNSSDTDGPTPQESPQTSTATSYNNPQ